MPRVPAATRFSIYYPFMAESAAALNQRHGIPGIATITEGKGGLTCVRLTTPHCQGEVYLLGGQVTRWKPEGTEEVLWVSEHSSYQIGKAIRGGVPVCFPWFGAKADDPKAPSHGFVRTRQWDVESIAANDDLVTVSLLTRSDKSTKTLWPADFELRLFAAFGPQLTVQFQLRNTGNQPLRAEEALHAYFHVGDVRHIAIEGLDGVSYLDKSDRGNRKVQAGEILFNSETDRVYLDTIQDVLIKDSALQRRITVRKENSRNSVVWNPWIDKARALSDFGDDEWPRMVCVEPSNVGANAIEVAPGQQHSMALEVAVSRL